MSSVIWSKKDKGLASSWQWQTYFSLGHFNPYRPIFYTFLHTNVFMRWYLRSITKGIWQLDHEEGDPSIVVEVDTFFQTRYVHRNDPNLKFQTLVCTLCCISKVQVVWEGHKNLTKFFWRPYNIWTLNAHWKILIPAVFCFHMNDVTTT